MTIHTKKIKNQHVAVSYEFIDRHMPKAPAEYVKVYLYLLRHNDEECLEDSHIAEALDLGRGTVTRAIEYLTRIGVYDGEQEEENSAAAAADESSTTASVDETYADMIYCLQQYLNTPFGQAEYETINYLYENLQMSPELIQYIAEICVQKNKKKLSFIKAVALDWHAKGIRTVEDAKKENMRLSEEIGCVMRAFGLDSAHRKPSRGEMALIKKWFDTDQLPMEVVEAACDRTMNNLHFPKFEYADKILMDWKKEGVTTRAEAEQHMAAFSEKSRKEHSQPAVSRNTLISDIRSEYDTLLRKEKEEQQQRVEEVYRRIPRIREIDETISRSALQTARNRISGGSEIDSAAKLDTIKSEKEQLLREAGFAPDYLQIRYTCPDCRDTGFIDGRKCHCFIEKEESRRRIS